MNENIFSYDMPRKGVCARARLEFPEMVVLSGSVVAQDETPRMPDQYRALRRRLLEEGIIGWQGGYLVFLRDHRFTSSSAAVCVVEGGSRNGYVAWRNQHGQTLRDLGYQR